MIDKSDVCAIIRISISLDKFQENFDCYKYQMILGCIIRHYFQNRIQIIIILKVVCFFIVILLQYNKYRFLKVLNLVMNLDS